MEMDAPTDMTSALSLPLPLMALGGLVAGLLLGLAYFATLAATVRFYTEGRPLAAGLLQAGRFVALAGALFGLAKLGALPLVCGGLGIVLGRQLVMRRKREARP